MDRTEFAAEHRQTYLDACAHIAEGPWTDLDKTEFALISAHCRFDKAVHGFHATRNTLGVVDTSEALFQAGVFCPGDKGARIAELRERVQDEGLQLPGGDLHEYRREVRIRGLGYCKLSFAACLIAPMESDIICLDTHMLQAYLGRRITKRDTGSIYVRLGRDEEIERALLEEAVQIGMPPFAYQWAVWDWQRGRAGLQPANHSFLWEGV